jgi:hypothetical protein
MTIPLAWISTLLAVMVIDESGGGWMVMNKIINANSHHPIIRVHGPGSHNRFISAVTNPPLSLGLTRDSGIFPSGSVP